YAEVIQDGTTNDETHTSSDWEGALSDDKGNTIVSRTPTYDWDKKGGLEVITKLKGPVEIKATVKIQTVYGPGASPEQLSGSGRGTTPEDEKAGNTSLGFHESCHRKDYLDYLKTKALPAFGGKVGMTRTQYEQAVAAFSKAIAKYIADMIQD